MTGEMLLTRYLIQEQIGSGGMSDVYHGLDLNTGREVAVKVLKEEYATDDEFLRRFHREAQAAAALEHENLVGVYDLGQEDTCNFIIMEYVDGPTLKDMIRERGALPTEDLVEIGLQLCAAMQAAHEKHIIHRDIKPQNILIKKEDGKVKLTDFGIARAASATTLTVADGSVLGSVHYFSPEQAKGEVATEQSDLYSLGVVLYEMGTGKVPFEGDSPVTVALQHLQGEIPDPHRVNPDISQALCEIIAKALKRDPQERYQSAQEVADDLRLVLIRPQGGFVQAHRISASDPTRIMPIVQVQEDVRQGEMDASEDHYDEEEDEKRHKQRVYARPGKAGIIALVVVALACVGIGMLFFHLITGMTNTQVKGMVPHVEQMQEEAAKVELEQAGYVVARAYEFSDATPSGAVISQDPAAQTQHNKGAVVTLLVSRGQEAIVVQNYVGLTREEAAEAIRKDDLILGEVVLDPHSDKVRGTVTSQVPNSGTMLRNGDEVSLSVSDRSVMVKVPELQGKSLAEASKLVEDQGLVLEGVVYEETTDLEPDKVFKQSPLPQSAVINGSGVTLWVSAEPVARFKRTILITMMLPDGDCDVEVYLESEEGERTKYYTGLSEGNEFKQTLNLEEAAGRYRIVVSVNEEKQAVGGQYAMRIYVDGRERENANVTFE